MSKNENLEHEVESLRKQLARQNLVIGAIKGGSAGGKRKARTSAQARRAVAQRWLNYYERKKQKANP